MHYEKNENAERYIYKKKESAEADSRIYWVIWV